MSVFRHSIAMVSAFALLTASAQGAVVKRGAPCPGPEIPLGELKALEDLKIKKLPEGNYTKLPPPQGNYVKLPAEPPRDPMGKLPTQPKNYVKLPGEPSEVMGKLPEAPKTALPPPPPPVTDAKLPPTKALPPPPPPIAKNVPDVKPPPTKAPIYDRVPDDVFKEPPVQYSKLPADPTAPKGPKLSPAEELANKVGAEPPSETTLNNKVSKNVGAPGEPPPKPPMRRLPGSAPRDVPLRMEAPPKDAPSVKEAKAPMKLKTKIIIGGIATTVVLGGIGIGAPYAFNALFADDPSDSDTANSDTAQQ